MGLSKLVLSLLTISTFDFPEEGHSKIRWVTVDGSSVIEFLLPLLSCMQFLLVVVAAAVVDWVVFQALLVTVNDGKEDRYLLDQNL